MPELVRVDIAGDGVPEAEVLVAGCFEGEDPGLPDLPEALAGALRRAAGRSGFRGREKQAVEATVEGERGAVAAVVLHGLGKRQDLDPRKLSSWLDRGLESLRTNGVERAVWALPDCAESRGPAAAERVCRRLALGAYRFDRYREVPEGEAVRLRQVSVLPPAGEAEAYRGAERVASAIAEGVALSRDLANTPGNVASPPWMEERAREIAVEHGMAVEVLGPRELAERGMEGILAVGRGSAHPPRLVLAEWGSDGPVVALVGKGVTFDTGGISIKPAARLDEMKYDKSGACTVLGIARAAARLELPLRLRLYLPLAENMPDGAAYRPGDIIRCYNGKTVEILNTDAEGRLILADALALAVEQGPDALVELSTLTGACVVALGHHGAGLYSPDDELAAGLLAGAEAGGERLWRLPLWPEFAEEMQGTHADLKNTGGRWGGANTAAAFLATFLGEHRRWAHLDIAGPAQVAKEDNGSNGATGYGVPLIVNWLRGLAG
jgi:leucyl aminopeptidase